MKLISTFFLLYLCHVSVTIGCIGFMDCFRKMFGRGSSTGFVHEISLYRGIRLDRKKVETNEICYGTILDEYSILTDGEVVLKFFPNQLYSNAEGKKDQIYFDTYQKLKSSNGQIIKAISDSPLFPKDWKVDIWNEIDDGPIEVGPAVAFDSERNSEIICYVDFDETDHNFLKVVGLEVFFCGMSLMMKGKLIGMYVSHNDQMECLFAKITEQTLTTLYADQKNEA